MKTEIKTWRRIVSLMPSVQIRRLWCFPVTGGERDNTTKDTLHNVRATGECVINAVNYAIVRQMAVASVDFPTGVSEFEKTGLTPIPSDLVKAYRVAESPAHMECKVKEIIPLGENGGAGHLIICEVVRMHVAKDVLSERNRIDPHKMDLMGRMGQGVLCAVQWSCHTYHRAGI